MEEELIPWAGFKKASGTNKKGYGKPGFHS